MNNSDVLPWAQRLAVFDLETTGIDVRSARIVSACVGQLDSHGEVLSQRDWIADPGIEIPAQATAVHGISTERARAEGQSAATVVAEIIESLREIFAAGVAVVVYNAPFDFSLLAAEAARHGVEPLRPIPVIDPLVIDKQLDRYRKGKRTLEAVAAVYDVELIGAHDAGADAFAAGHIARALATRYAKQLAMTAADLHEEQRGWFREQAERYQGWVRQNRDPNFAASTAWPVRGDDAAERSA